MGKEFEHKPPPQSFDTTFETGPKPEKGPLKVRWVAEEDNLAARRRREKAEEHHQRKERPESVGELTEDATAKDWLKTFAAQIKEGRRGKPFVFVGRKRLREMIYDAVIPHDVIFDVNGVLGYQFEDRELKDPNIKKGKPFNLKAITSELGCSRSEAANLVAFSFLQREAYGIENTLEYYDEWEHLREDVPREDFERIKRIFRDKKFLANLKQTSFEGCARVLSEHMTLPALVNLYRSRRMDENSALFKKHFATEKRKQEFFEFFRLQDIEGSLLALPVYESIFGELAREEFLAIFPKWYEAERYIYHKYRERYELALPGKILRKEAREDETWRQKQIAEEERRRAEAEKMERPAPEEPPRPWQIPGITGKNLLRGGIAALTLLTIGGGAKLLAEHLETDESGITGQGTQEDKERGAPGKKSEQGTYNFEPAIRQREKTTVNNLTNETLEYKKTSEARDFFSVPPFFGMHATEAYTHIEPRGVLRHNSNSVFELDENLIGPENARKHTVGRRVFAKGVVLYPPEMGRVDPNSIYLKTNEPVDFTVEKGELGRYRVTLRETPREPFIVIYEIWEMGPGMGLPYKGEAPKTPKVNNPELKTIIQKLEFVRGSDEDELRFALRVENLIRAKSRYPVTRREKDLTFNEAVKQAIEDCDAVNKELMAVLQENGIPAMMIYDMKPVPGNLPHGRLRAIVDSKERGRFIVSLDATPDEYTEEGQRELMRKEQEFMARAASERISTPPLVEDKPLTEDESLTEKLRELVMSFTRDREKLLGRQKCAQKASGASKPTNENPIVVAEGASVLELPQTTEFETEVKKHPWENLLEWHDHFTRADFDRQKESFKGGLWGFAEFLLQKIGGTRQRAREYVNALYADETRARTDLGYYREDGLYQGRDLKEFKDWRASRTYVNSIAVFTRSMERLLRQEGIIPPEADFEEWSRHITPRMIPRITEVIKSRIPPDSAQNDFGWWI